ncbi:MAG: hypothetical protein MJ252_25620 [archaeon]|nr:hypothetical protein [archaeon]
MNINKIEDNSSSKIKNKEEKRDNDTLINLRKALKEILEENAKVIFLFI